MVGLPAIVVTAVTLWTITLGSPHPSGPGPDVSLWDAAPARRAGSATYGRGHTRGAAGRGNPRFSAGSWPRGGRREPSPGRDGDLARTAARPRARRARDRAAPARLVAPQPAVRGLPRRGGPRVRGVGRQGFAAVRVRLAGAHRPAVDDRRRAAEPHGGRPGRARPGPPLQRQRHPAVARPGAPRPGLLLRRAARRHQRSRALPR